MIKIRHIARPLPVTSLLLAIAVLGSSGCSPEGYALDADRSVQRILPGKSEEVIGNYKESVIYPERKETVETPPESTEPQALSLKKALEIAFRSNRSYMSEKESLFLTALSLVGTRHTFSPQLSAVLSYLYNDGSDTDMSQSSRLGLDLSQRLPLGGTVSISGDSTFQGNYASGITDPGSFSSSLGVSLSQPLLRGAGREVAYNSLIQAERNLVYAIRSFELYRQRFAIDTASRFYSLVREIQSLDNQHRNMDSVIHAREKAEALHEVGSASLLDVLRAKTSELNSKNSLIAAEESLNLNMDRFLIYLGLPTTQKIEIVPLEIEPALPDYDIRSAVEVAFCNRLDLLTRREQLEDSERNLRIAKNSLLPDLDLNLGYSVSTASDPSYFDQKRDRDSWSAGLSLEIPLDRVNERNSYRSAQISHGQAGRSLEEFEDELVIEIETAIRELKRRWQSLEIQGQQIEVQGRTTRIAEIQFNQGEIENRDFLEAKQALLEAENSLISERVDFEITRLRLLMDLGILFIDENGMWSE